MCIFARENGYTAEDKKYILDLLAYCRKIKPHVDFYKQQIKTYNDTVHHILKNEIDLILPQLPKNQKQGIITALVSGFIGLAYEGISSFLMDSKTTMQHNKLMHLEDSMVMYGIHNAETSEKLIKYNTLH